MANDVFANKMNSLFIFMKATQTFTLKQQHSFDSFFFPVTERRAFNNTLWHAIFFFISLFNHNVHIIKNESLGR